MREHERNVTNMAHAASVEGLSFEGHRARAPPFRIFKDDTKRDTRMEYKLRLSQKSKVKKK